jgi:hypothetical protein
LQAQVEDIVAPLVSEGSNLLWAQVGTNTVPVAGIQTCRHPLEQDHLPFEIQDVLHEGLFLGSEGSGCLRLLLGGEDLSERWMHVFMLRTGTDTTFISDSEARVLVGSHTRYVPALTAPVDVVTRADTCLRTWTPSQWAEPESPTGVLRELLPQWDVIIDGQATGLTAAYLLRWDDRWLLVQHPVDQDPSRAQSLQPDVHGWWATRTWRQRRDWWGRSLMVSREWSSLVDMAMDVAVWTDDWTSTTRARYAVARGLQKIPDQRATLEVLNGLAPSADVGRLLSLGA